MLKEVRRHLKGGGAWKGGGAHGSSSWKRGGSYRRPDEGQRKPENSFRKRFGDNSKKHYGSFRRHRERRSTEFSKLRKTFSGSKTQRVKNRNGMKCYDCGSEYHLCGARDCTGKHSAKAADGSADPLQLLSFPAYLNTLEEDHASESAGVSGEESEERECFSSVEEEEPDAGNSSPF